MHLNSDDATFDQQVRERARAQLAQATDKLGYLRNVVTEMRDLEQEIADIEETLEKKKAQRRSFERETLPTLFLEAGIQHLGLEARGNQPAATYELKEYYHAVIAASWEEPRREEAFALLETMKLGDIIKNVIEIPFGRGENALFHKTCVTLARLKVLYTVKRAVPWASLTAAVKERYRKDKPLSDQDKRILGADVGFIVKLKS